MDLELARRLSRPANTKIVLCVIDGLGGLARQETLRSEMERADLPNLDRLTERSEVGLTVPVGAGITPGSGPGHLALFGYDPLKSEAGRGALEAAGAGIALAPGDVAARGDFCTMSDDGCVADRRAGRLETAEAERRIDVLKPARVPGVDVTLTAVGGHRFIAVFRGKGLDPRVGDTDPQVDGEAPLDAAALAPEAGATAKAAGAFVAAASEALRGEAVGNGVLLRGFSGPLALPSVASVWKLRAAALADGAMYRGLAIAAGMEVLEAGPELVDKIAAMKEHWDEHDYFYLHYKAADEAGEDGDFDAKCHALERFDSQVPALHGLGADVLMVAGDHSTPALLGGHSWHPVPFLLHSNVVREGYAMNFNEQECVKGSLGIFPAMDVMPLAMAHAGRMAKFGA